MDESNKNPDAPAGQLVQNSGSPTVQSVSGESTAQTANISGALPTQIASIMSRPQGGEEPQPDSESTNDQDNTAVLGKQKKPTEARTIDISTLGEEELLNLVVTYVKSMTTFAGANRNVHKEIKHTLSNTGVVLGQYLKLRKAGSLPSKSKVHKSASTQTEESTHVSAQTEEKPATISAKNDVCTSDASTDTPCWWPVMLEQKKQQRSEQRPEQRPEIAEQTTHTSKWTDVVKRKNSKNKLLAKDEPSGLQEARKPRTRARPSAIMVDIVNENDFPALAKRIKSGMDGKLVGNMITGMRKARNGGLLLEIRGDDSSVEAIKTEVARTTGEIANVRVLQQKTLVEIRDIDSWSDKADIVESIARDTTIEKDSINIVSLRTAYRSQTALVLLPMSQARLIVAKGRLKISVVSCRVRLAEKRRARCFKCLAFGHEAKDCNGIDRKLNCRRCGKTEHVAKDCTAEISEASAFRKILESEAQNLQKTGPAAQK